MEGSSATRLAELSLTDFSDRLASAEPVPGGGSASAIAGSLAASLLAMVARLSIDRPKYEPYAATNARALEAAERARVRLLDLADEDARAYAGFSAALKLPKETDEQREARDEALRQAARSASEVPLIIARECAAILEQVESMAGRSNVNAASDLEVAARLATAAARGATSNVLVNLPHVGDQRFVGITTAEVGDLLHTVERNVSQVAQRVARGGLREPESA
jgi:methenyltetrahydrofolate cyclohydrolase